MKCPYCGEQSKSYDEAGTKFACRCGKVFTTKVDPEEHLRVKKELADALDRIENLRDLCRTLERRAVEAEKLLLPFAQVYREDDELQSRELGHWWPIYDGGCGSMITIEDLAAADEHLRKEEDDGTKKTETA